MLTAMSSYLTDTSFSNLNKISVSCIAILFANYFLVWTPLYDFFFSVLGPDLVLLLTNNAPRLALINANMIENGTAALFGKYLIFFYINFIVTITMLVLIIVNAKFTPYDGDHEYDFYQFTCLLTCILSLIGIYFLFINDAELLRESRYLLSPAPSKGIFHFIADTLMYVTVAGGAHELFVAYRIYFLRLKNKPS